MVCEVFYTDGEKQKFTKTVYVGVLGSRNDCLYIQTRRRGNPVESFIPLKSIRTYHVRDPL